MGAGKSGDADQLAIHAAAGTAPSSKLSLAVLGPRHPGFLSDLFRPASGAGRDPAFVPVYPRVSMSEEEPRPLRRGLACAWTVQASPHPAIPLLLAGAGKEEDPLWILTHCSCLGVRQHCHCGQGGNAAVSPLRSAVGGHHGAGCDHAFGHAQPAWNFVRASAWRFLCRGGCASVFRCSAPLCRMAVSCSDKSL